MFDTFTRIVTYSIIVVLLLLILSFFSGLVLMGTVVSANGSELARLFRALLEGPIRVAAWVVLQDEDVSRV